MSSSVAQGAARLSQGGNRSNLGDATGVREGDRRPKGASQLCRHFDGDLGVPLSTQWTDVLDTFCEDEFGVKTRQFHCCHRLGAERRRCFADATVATAEITEITEITVFEPMVVPSFPPGEPTAANMENICRLRGLRPSPRGLPGARARFHSRLERDFGRCCHNSSLECAHAAVSWGWGGPGGGRELWGGYKGGWGVIGVVRGWPSGRGGETGGWRVRWRSGGDTGGQRVT